MVNIDQVKIIKKLGAGVIGTTYLATYKNNNYALKIQKILKQIKIVKNYKIDMWRELSLYDYINKMKKEDRIFFTKIYDYKIYNNCTHKQERKIELDVNNRFHRKIIKLDKSKWCIKYLTEYKGNTTLSDFVKKDKLTSKLALSFCLQIAKIMFLLYKGGYSHNDLHPENIMINKTTTEYFSFNGKKIKTHGYLLSAIDYGEVLHKKFGIKYKKYYSIFLNDRKKWLFYEYSRRMFDTLDNVTLLLKDCHDKKQKLPSEYKGLSESVFIKIVIDHDVFFNEMKNKYLLLFPGCNKLLDNVIKIIKNDPLSLSFRNIMKKRGGYGFWRMIDRIFYEFRIKYPEEFTTYHKLCSIRPLAISNDKFIELLTINNFDDLINKIYSFL